MAYQPVSEGNVVDHVLTAAAVEGTGQLLGNSSWGIPVAAGAIGDTVGFAVEGTWEHAAESADTWATGDKLYWNDTNKTLTDTVGSNRLIGVAAGPKAASETTAKIKIVLSPS